MEAAWQQSQRQPRLHVHVHAHLHNEIKDDFSSLLSQTLTRAPLPHTGTHIHASSFHLHPSFLPLLSFSLSLYEGRMGGDARAECVFSCSVLYGTGEEEGEARRSPPLVTESVLWHCAPASYFLNGPKGMWLKAVCSLRACNRVGFKPDPEMNHTAPVDALISSVFWLRGH